MKSKNWTAKYVVNGWQFGLVQLVASSLPQAPTIYVSDAAVSDTAWKPAGASIMSYSSLNGLGGSSRVPWQSISAVSVGNQFRTDLRISKNFPLTERVNMALGFEGVNVLNSLLASSRETREYYTYYQSTGPAATKVAIVPNAAFNSINATSITPDGTTARRMQATARFTW